jgi:predicted esterase
VEEHHLSTARRARYYTAGDSASPDDVWIVCHGFGQLAAPFGRQFERLVTPGRLIVAPEALNRYYLGAGSSGSTPDARVAATWMTREDRDNEIADYVEWLDKVHARTVPDDARVTALGFSQGVATVTRWITLGSRVVHRFVAWTGQLPPDVDLSVLGARLRRPVVLVRGSTDRLGEWVRPAENASRLEAAGIPFEVVTFEGGHRLDDAVLDQIAAS